jgi:hypothetical protein
MLHLQHGIRAKVAILLLCVNCQLLQRQIFCFWVRLSTFNNSAGGYMCHESVMMDQKFWDLLVSVLFCS